MTHSSQTLGISWVLRVIKLSFVMWMRWFVKAPEHRGWVWARTIQVIRRLELWLLPLPLGRGGERRGGGGEERRGEGSGGERRGGELEVNSADSGQWFNPLCLYNEASMKILRGDGVQNASGLVNTGAFRTEWCAWRGHGRSGPLSHDLDLYISVIWLFLLQ